MESAKESLGNSPLWLAMRMAYLCGEDFRTLDGWTQAVFVERAQQVIAAGMAAAYYQPDSEKSA